MKRINKEGLTEVIDSIRTACRDIQIELDKMHPNIETEIKSFECKHNIHEMTNNLFIWLSDFKDEKKWDIRDDGDSFEK